jgi:stearoyl-CoA desaturase (delta-9 desaturase)
VDLFVILLFYFVYCGIGIGMMYHRYFSHHSFSFKHKFVEKIFTLISALAGRGSPLGWVYVHRLHHAFSDTEKDPHSPFFAKFRIFYPSLLGLVKEFNVKIVKDMLSKFHRKLNNYYVLFILSFTIVLSLIDVKLLFICWIIPVSITAWMMSFSTFLNHYWGYTNHETRDNSRNNLFFGYLMFGEGWHNNHHKFPNSYTTKEKWWELDITSIFLKIMEKLNLIQIKYPTS